MRSLLVASAAHVLATNGPVAFTARRVSAHAETSTMAVYTHFGSMQSLVAAVIQDGFAGLERQLVDAPQTDDPLADVSRQTMAYVAHATQNPELYAVMFGTASLGRYRPRSTATGRHQTLDRIAANWQRAVDAHRLEPARASHLAFRWWSAIHGYAMLEIGGYIDRDPGLANVLQPLLESLYVGAGDAPASAAKSASHVHDTAQAADR